MGTRTTLAVIALVVARPVCAADPIDLPTFVAISRPAPTLQLNYVSAPSQTIDVFLPAGFSPRPVAVLIHGGCWTAHTAGREQLRHLGTELARQWIAVWSIGYRRADEAGGGYPGTFQDVCDAIDRLRSEAPQYNLDIARTVLVGHSAGGHLALWAAARNHLPAGSPLYRATPLFRLLSSALPASASSRRSPLLFR
ncbi:MAG: alpha/beta hydrolase [Beijerinckiaceae bacterium]